MTEEAGEKTSSELPTNYNLRMFLLCVALFVLVALNCPSAGQTCEIPEGDRLFILTRIKAKIVEALGPPPTQSPLSSPAPSPSPRAKPEQRNIRKRHSRVRSGGLEDVSQVILFPSSDVLCETPHFNASQEGLANSFTYVFRPSPHILSRKVVSVQLWFYTGSVDLGLSQSLPDEERLDRVPLHPTPPAQNTGHEYQPPSRESPSHSEHHISDTATSSFNSTDDEDDDDDNDDAQHPPVDLQVLSGDKAVTVATPKVERVDDWTVFYLAPAFQNYLTQGLFVLLVHCPTCPCTNQPEFTPFLTYSTRPAHRSRRSRVPWSPSALELLQRPPVSGVDSTQCHRGSLNISFGELGWDQWIVHPGSFQFHYCHGTCSPNHSLTQAMHWGYCCASLPSTMKSLWVTTTTDGGFSYRYETVPNLLTQDCACS
ncbi:inhibin alpha chain [Spea bombifrons]|uniref:inhibin alpha chain n=1 Tax=Spea bombifrons TaxID=233779 RepID=UPI002349765B|nr:inhibin alpha chain [Spea bombifrons]